MNKTPELLRKELGMHIKALQKSLDKAARKAERLEIEDVDYLLRGAYVYTKTALDYIEEKVE